VNLNDYCLKGLYAGVTQWPGRRINTYIRLQCGTYNRKLDARRSSTPSTYDRKYAVNVRVNSRYFFSAYLFHTQTFSATDQPTW